MKKHISLLWNILSRFVLLLIVFFILVKIDRFALGMMNPHHSIKFGLGVSLFVGTNVIAFISVRKVLKSIMNVYFQSK